MTSNLATEEVGEVIRILVSTSGMVTIERRGPKGTTYRCSFIYRSDLPEGGCFGDCPRCWKQGGVLINDGWVFDDSPDIWMVCRKHHVKWFVGSGLFSARCDMTDQELLRGHYLLSSFQEVRAIMDYRLTAEYTENKRLNRDPFSIAPEGTGKAK